MNDSQPKRSSSNYYVLLFGGIMLLGLLFLAWMGTPPVVSAVGEPLPRIDLQPLLGAEQPVTNDELSGKVVVFHFWGTWCPPCQAEFPEFVKLAREFADHPGVQIISVSSSPGPEYDLESLRENTAAFMTQHDVPIATYADPAALTRQKLALLLPHGTFRYPTTLLVDGQGKIVDAMVGYLPGEMEKLTAKIKSML